MNKNNCNIFIGLIHHPVYDKNQKIVTTAVTNLDVHDLARMSMVFDVKRFYLVVPLASQQELVHRIKRHWCEGFGSVYNPTRSEAFSRTEVVGSLAEAIGDIGDGFGGGVFTVATSARACEDTVGFLEMRKLFECRAGNYFLLFGTGWGLTRELIAKCDYVLEPIVGQGEFNHLPVRAAVAISLDRLLGRV